MDKDREYYIQVRCIYKDKKSKNNDNAYMSKWLDIPFDKFLDKIKEVIREEIRKEMEEYLETHCIYCGKRKDIPDGWDVVKEIYEFVKNTSNGIKEQEKIGIEYNASGSLRVAQIFIENKLRDIGIEVE